MLKHVLVPLDGNPRSEDLLSEVRRLVVLGASKLTLLRAELPVAVDEYSVITEAILEQSQRYLEEMRAGLADLAIPVETLARIGPPAATTLEVAESIQASLIAIASPRRSRLARFLLGSVSERIVQRSRIPVLVVPPRWSYDLAPSSPLERRPIRNILVPLNGDLCTAAILPAALEIAGEAKSRVILASVLRSSPDGPTRDAFEDAEEILYAAGARCAEAGVDFSVVVEYGDPSEQILAVCRERSVDWVAMATRGRSAFSRWLLPSTTNRILWECDHPVLTVRLKPAADPASFREVSLPGHS